MENKYLGNYIGVACMIISNVVLDIVFVFGFHMGVWGLGLATSISNWAYFLVLLFSFIKAKTVFTYRLSGILWDKLGEMILIGFPGAILVICLAARYLVINRLLITYGGEGGLPAMSAFNMITGLFLAVGIGNGSVVRMLTSVFIGEGDREGVPKMFRIVYTRVMFLSVVLGILVLVFSGQLAAIFFPDTTTEVFRQTKTLFAMYCICIPLVLICTTTANYAQALRKNVFVNVASVFDGFLGMVIPSMILAPILGATGVWISLVLGIAITAALGFIYSAICNKGIPKDINSLLLIDEAFGPDVQPRLSETIRSREEVTSLAERVQRFCTENQVSPKKAYYVALCLEETARNVVDHGFHGGKGTNSVDVRVFLKEDGKIFTTVRDDCVPFNPVEWAEITAGGEMGENIGIRMVQRIASEVSYQNMLGLNVLSIRIDPEG